MKNMPHADLRSLNDEQVILECKYLITHIAELAEVLKNYPSVRVTDKIPGWKRCEDLQYAIERYDAICEELKYRIIP